MTARVVGVLFIVATVTSIVGGVLVMQALDAPDYLVQVAAHEGQVMVGVALEFILALSVIGMAALMLPVLRPYGEGMAVGYVAVRTLEAAFILVATTTALLVLALGQDWGSAAAVGVEPVGSALLSAREWTYFVGTMPLFGVSAVILNTLLYRSRLVPAWLSLWGLVGGALLLTYPTGVSMLHAGHGLVTLNTGLMIVVALYLGRVVTTHGAGWAGLIGTLLAVLGTVCLAADKGALCLTMSALDGLSDDEFAAARPALAAIFAKKGWLWLLWGIVLIPIGFAVLAIAALASGATSPWVAILLLVGVLLIGFPDGAEIVNLSAAVIMAAGLVPFGLTMMLQ